MLVKLMPEQISEHWPLIKYAIKESTQEITSYGLNVVLENLLVDLMQCWWEVEEHDQDMKLLAVIVTSLYRDTFFQAPVLRICVIFSYDELPISTWLSGLATLRSYAIGKECVRIEAYTDREDFEPLIKRLGGRVGRHLILEV